MKLLPVLLLALAACSPAADSDGNGSVTAANAASNAATPASAADSSEALTGLYESGGAAPTDQMCIVEEGKGAARFGLVVWGGGLHSCSGTGTVTRKGGTLRLAMTGDETCAIDATLRDGVVTLPDSIPQGCAYYCGARASLAGARFARTARGEAASRKATDLVGEPLCHPER